MTRTTHDAALDHHGHISESLLATGTATPGYVPVASGTGTAGWAPASGGGGGGSLTVTDGTTSVTGVTSLTISGSTVFGSTPNATAVVTGGGGGGGAPVTDLLTGDDSTFTTTIGSWTADTGTVLHDGTVGYTSASMKWSVPHDSASPWSWVTVSGSFEAGSTYQAIVAFTKTATVTNNARVRLGNVTAADWATVYTSSDLFSGGAWTIQLVEWTPSATHTEASLMVGLQSYIASDVDVHVGYARIVKVNTMPGLKFGWDPVIGIIESGLSISGGGASMTVDQSGFFAASPAQGNGSGGMVSTAIGLVQLSGGASGAPSDRDGATGVAIGLAPDNVYLNVNERDATTVQVFSSTDSDVELADGATRTFRMRAFDDGVAVPSKGMLPQYAAAPASPVEGQSYYDTTAHKSFTWDGTTWQSWW